MPSSRGSFQSRDEIHVSYVSCISRQVLYHQRHPSSFLPIKFGLKFQFLTRDRKGNGMQACPDHPLICVHLPQGAPTLQPHWPFCRGLGSCILPCLGLTLCLCIFPRFNPLPALFLGLCSSPLLPTWHYIMHLFLLYVSLLSHLPPGIQCLI